MPLHPQVIPLLEIMNQAMGGNVDGGIPDVATMRTVQMAPPPEIPTPVGKVVDRKIPGPAGELPVRIYTPEGQGPFPLIVFFHGGGWVVCDLDTHDESCRALCRDVVAVVVSVDYRLAPEAKYPAATDDCYAALVWCAANATALGADAGRLAVVGDSAGGNLAAVTALRARDLGGPAIRHQALIYPVTDSNFELQSYRENAEGYLLTAGLMRWFWGHYIDVPEQLDEAYVCPLRATDLGRLPPASVITAEYDPLRDEGEQYAEALRAAGVPVTLKRYEGMIHGFFNLADMLEVGRQAQLHIARELRMAFGQPV